jgi:hypothetical protein
MKEMLSQIAILISILGYIPYINDLAHKRTKPHAFSWLIWGVLTMVIFVIQLNNGGGLASWVAGSTGIMSLIIFGFSLKFGEKRITLFDWSCLVLAFVAILVWLIVDQPLFAAILLTFIDVLGFAPTFRKTYLKPYEETLSTQVLSTVKHGLTVLSLSNLNFVTAIYPISLFASTLVFVIMVIYRRQTTKEKP